MNEDLRAANRGSATVPVASVGVSPKEFVRLEIGGNAASLVLPRR